MKKLAIFNTDAYRVDVNKAAQDNQVIVSTRYGLNFLDDIYRVLRFTNNLDQLTSKVSDLTEKAISDNWSDNGERFKALDIRAETIEECVFVQVLLPRNMCQESTIKNIMERALEKQVLPELQKMTLEINTIGF